MLVIFVVSTFGNGDAPTDAKKLKLELNDILNGGGGGVLKSLKYMVLALGSKSYPNFCAFGKFLDTTLEKLGAVKETKVCLVDEMSQPQETFKAWLQDLAFTLGIGQATSNHQSRVKLLENVENKKVERKKQLFRKMSRNQNEFFRCKLGCTISHNLAVLIWMSLVTYSVEAEFGRHRTEVTEHCGESDARRQGGPRVQESSLDRGRHRAGRGEVPDWRSRGDLPAKRAQLRGQTGGQAQQLPSPRRATAANESKYATYSILQ